MRYLFILLLIPTLLSGCVLHQKIREHKQAKINKRLAQEAQKNNSIISNPYANYLEYRNYEVEIISDPPGAKIELNDGYIGETPLDYVFNGTIGSLATTVIRALPVASGQRVRVPGTEHRTKII